MTQCLMRTVNESGKLHMTPALLNETYIMRWCACAEWLADDDVFVAWNVIQAAADDIIRTRNKVCSALLCQLTSSTNTLAQRNNY